MRYRVVGARLRQRGLTVDVSESGILFQAAHPLALAGTIFRYRRLASTRLRFPQDLNSFSGRPRTSRSVRKLKGSRWTVAGVPGLLSFTRATQALARLEDACGQCPPR